MKDLRPAAVVYGAAVVLGLVLVSIPALSAWLRSSLHLDDARYGALFLPQMAGSVAGSVLGGAVASRLGLRRLLIASLVMAALAELALLAAPALGYGVLLAASGFVGLAFGIGAAPLNAAPPALFPARVEASLAATHVSYGIGLAAGPAMAALCGAVAYAWILAASCLGVALLTVPLPTVAAAARGTGTPVAHPAFWALVATALLYGCAEATFSNWAIVFLTEERGLKAADAALGLAAFWAAITLGRLGLLVRPVPWLVAPALTVVALVLLPRAGSTASAIVLYTLGGLACSTFVPLVLGLAIRRFPEHAAAVASSLIGAISLGLGVGSFATGLLRGGRTLADVFLIATAYPLLTIAIGVLVWQSRPGAPAATPASAPP